MQVPVGAGVTSPATGSELHASGPSFDTHTSKQTQEDVKKELHHHSSFVRGLLSGRPEWEEEWCWELVTLFRRFPRDTQNLSRKPLQDAHRVLL